MYQTQWKVRVFDTGAEKVQYIWGLVCNEAGEKRERMRHTTRDTRDCSVMMISKE